MTLTTDNTARFCSRCRLPLTDAASRECGVGPVCRRKDNHLFAKTIRANYPMALALLMGLPEDGSALAVEARPTFKRMRKALMRRAERAANASDTATFNAGGQDLRKIVTDLDFLCSFSHHGRVASGSNVRDMLTGMVRHLGYVGLAGVLDGVASTSPAKIWFENGRVYLSGLGCTDGFRAMRSIPGIVTPRRRGDRTPYSAPAAAAAAFFTNVGRFWPLYEGDMYALAAEAAAWADTHAASESAGLAMASTVTRAPAPTVFEATRRSADFYVKFPWVRGANMAGLTTAFKTIPSSDRSYDPASKLWSFRLNHFDAVMRMARESGIFGEVRERLLLSSPEETPSSLYNRSGAGRYPYLARRAWRPSYGRM